MREELASAQAVSLVSRQKNSSWMLSGSRNVIIARWRPSTTGLIGDRHGVRGAAQRRDCLSRVGVAGPQGHEARCTRR